MALELAESTAYEFKVKVEERKKSHWRKTVSAFANGRGGILIFGVDDDGSVVGLKDVKHAAEVLSEAINNLMDPRPQVSLDLQKREVKDLLFLHVFHGVETPYFYLHENNRIA